MNDRIHRALDGELRTNDISRAESEELGRTRSLLDDVLRAIPSPPVPRLGASVINRIGAVDTTTEPATRKSLIGWLWAPKRIAIRPAHAIGIAAILAIAIGVTISRSNVQPTAAATVNGEVFVHFKLEAPTATTVSLAGDFNNWAPTYHMKRSEPGVWTIVIPLTPGVHDYSFIIDGSKWVPDPAAPAMADGFGGMNSRISVIAADERRSL